MAYYLNRVLATDLCRTMRRMLFGYSFSCDFPKIVAATRRGYETYFFDSDKHVPQTILFKPSDFTDFNGWFEGEKKDERFPHVSTLTNETGIRWLRLIALTEVAVTLALEDLARHNMIVSDPETLATDEALRIIEWVQNFRVETSLIFGMNWNPEMWDGTSENAEPQQQIKAMLEMVREVLNFVLGPNERTQYVLDIIGTTYLGFDAPLTTWTTTNSAAEAAAAVYLVVIGHKLSDELPDECILLDNAPEMTTRIGDILGSGAAHVYKLPVIPAVARFVAKWSPLENEGDGDPDFVRDFALVEEVYLNIIRFCDNSSVTSCGLIDKGVGIVNGNGGNTILLGFQN